VSTLKKLLRTSQALLVSAFLFHLSGWVVEIRAILEMRALHGRAIGDISSYVSQSFFDLAYAFFYLGEAMILELLFRIWAAVKSQKTDPIESSEGT